MKSFFAKAKVGLLDALGIILLIALFFIYNFCGYTPSESSTKPIQTGMGYMLVPGEQADSFVMIDNGKGRVIGIDGGKVTYTISVGGSEDTFYQAENLCIDPADGSIYVQSVDWDSSGYLLATERILHFDAKGRYISTPYTRAYTPEDEVNQRRVYDPRIIDGKLYVLYADETGISQYRIENEEEIQTAFFPYEDAWIYFQNYRQLGEGNLYGVEKTGHILRFSGSGQETVYHYDSDSKEVIFFVETDPAGNVYYVDIYNGRVCRVLSETESEVLADVRNFYPKGSFTPGMDQMTTLKSNHAPDTRFGFMLNNRAVMIDGDGNVLMDAGEFVQSRALQNRALGLTVIFVLAAVCVIYYLLRVIFVIVVTKPHVKLIWKIEIGFGVFAIALTTVILSSMTNLFGSSYMQSLAEKLTDASIAGSNYIEPRWIGDVRDMSDYMGDSYASIIEVLVNMTTKNHEHDRRYGAEIEVLDEDGRAYCIAYTDNSIGVYYPLDESTKAELASIYETGDAVYNLSQVSAGGTFIFGRAPITDARGNVIAVLSMALDSYKEQERLSNMASNILINVILTVIIIMFLINEGFSLVSHRDEYIQGSGAYILGKNIPMHLMRLAVFGVSFVLNMTSSFLSVYTSGFWTESLGISPSLAGAIPLFANGAFTALSALFCPLLLEKMGFLGLTTLGVLCSGCGDLLAGLSNSYLSIVLALLLNGLGFGILINVLSITVGRISDEEQRKKGYSQFNAACIAGINCGMIAGSMLVSLIRYNQVFFVTSILWISLILCFIALNKYIPKVEKTVKEEKHAGGKISMQAVVYALFITFPYAVAGSFMYFYLPIFVTSLGYSEGYVSLLMMLYAACGIFLGQTLTKLSWFVLKRWSVFVAIVMAVSAWLIIAAYPTMGMVSMAMLLIGISCSFGLNVTMSAYMEGKDVAKMRQEDAVGIYEFSSRAGQCLSSIICGVMMGAGILYGMGIFAAISIGLFLVYMFVYRNK